MTIPAASPIRSVKFGADRRFQVTWQSTPGKTYEVAVTTDLVSWTTEQSSKATGTEMSYTDPSTTKLEKRFYRIKQLD